ncbi:MAG: hypothetical protein ABSF80_05505 [Chitinispirillaceae bacterium]|jgi:hypothetical protein
MKPVTPPEYDFFSSFTSLVSRKQAGLDKDILLFISESIKERYSEYMSKKNRPETVSLIHRSPQEKLALQKCYDNSAKFKNDLLPEESTDEDAFILRCPYCQLNFANTWDHFLPREEFPDYSVFHPNLIRSCHDCNDTKKIFHVIPSRKTLHPYYDNLSFQYLRCSIDLKTTLFATYYIETSSSDELFDPYVAGIVHEHFNLFGLERKFRSEASRKLSDFYIAVKNVFSASAKPLKQVQVYTLVDDHLSALRALGEGVNCWEYAFWSAMRLSTKLFDYLRLLGISE